MSLSIPLTHRNFKPVFCGSVKQRNGLLVELLCMTREPLEDGRQLIGIVTNLSGSRYVQTWFANGAYYIRGENGADLENLS